ncbi:MAG: alpha/beta fold hydrolase [Qingshengfaniella sp.]
MEHTASSGHSTAGGLDLGTVHLRYDIVGEGPPLVLVHGSAVDRTTWDRIVPALARTHRVITYDRRGYGESRHAPVRDHRVHREDLIALLERLAAGPAAVVGWSSGGNIALATAVKRPDLFTSLVAVEAPFHGLRHMNGAVLRTLLRLKARQIAGHPTQALEEFLRFGCALENGGNSYDRLPETDREILRRYPRQVLAEWDPHPFGVMHEHVSTRAVAAIPHPITWLLGGESPPWMRKLHDHVKRQRADIRTTVIPGAGHLMHVDAPDEFVAAILHGVS